MICAVLADILIFGPSAIPVLVLGILLAVILWTNPNELLCGTLSETKGPRLLCAALFHIAQIANPFASKKRNRSSGAIRPIRSPS